jgi:hypothetical protein
MSLFTDGPISSIEDLRAQDSQLLDVAVVEDINLTSKISLAQGEIGLELVTLLGRLKFADQPYFIAGLANVVVTPALTLWHTYRALTMTYRDAYFNQLSDRYAAKRDQFRQLATWSAEQLVQNGIGLAMRPVSQAATPTVITIQGGLPDGIYYVTTSWINERAEEGASAITVVASLAASTIQVDAGPPPNNGIGWNVYVGTSPDSMVLQNSSQVSPGQIWLQPPVLIQRGRTPGTGQQPDYFQTAPRVIQRG